MKHVLLLSAGAALLASAAWAQNGQPAPVPPPPPAVQPGGAAPGPDGAAAAPVAPGAAGPIAAVRRPPPPGPLADGGPGAPPPPGPLGYGAPPPPPPPGAHFRLEHGDAVVDVACGDAEPLKGCADMAAGLMDKLQALPKP